MESLVVDFDSWQVSGQRTQMLLTAAQLWSRYGYGPISLQRIAAEMGLPGASAVAGFRSKRELFDCLLAEMGTAFEVARRRLVATQRAQSQLLTIDQLAASLAEPIEQLSREGEHGRHLLALWRRYGAASAGDLSVRVRKASGALIDAAAIVLVRQDVQRSHEDMLRACCSALANAIQLLAAAHLELDEKLPADRHRVVTEIARQIRSRCAGGAEAQRVSGAGVPNAPGS